MDQENRRVKLTNLAPWYLTFSRKNTLGDVVIPPNGSMLMEREEIISQCYAGNKMLLGTDGHGGHACLLIDDAEIRKMFDFPDTQEAATDELLQKLFEYKQQATFEKHIKEDIVEDFERHRIIDYIKRKGVNDYSKIRFVEQYTGIRVG